MEMFKPTIVENYPDGPGPTRGAMFQDRFRGMHVLQRDENGLEKCVACFLCAAACPSNCIYIEAAENTPRPIASAAPSVTPRSTTSTTTAASSAAIAWKPAPPTPSPTATASSWRLTTPATWFIARSSCSRVRPRTSAPTPSSTRATTTGWPPRNNATQVGLITNSSASAAIAQRLQLLQNAVHRNADPRRPLLQLILNLDQRPLDHVGAQQDLDLVGLLRQERRGSLQPANIP